VFFGRFTRVIVPGLATADLTLARSIALTARVTAESRAEAYDVPNSANDSLPGCTPGEADFGVISSARPAPTAQLGARLTC
jgi:hypothetical protein